jgi:hypothetical protein
VQMAAVMRWKRWRQSSGPTLTKHSAGGVSGGGAGGAKAAGAADPRGAGAVILTLSRRESPRGDAERRPSRAGRSQAPDANTTGTGQKG